MNRCDISILRQMNIYIYIKAYKICSRSLIIKEMQIKFTTGLCYTH